MTKLHDAMMYAKSCVTCKFSGTPDGNEPCHTCVAKPDQWSKYQPQEKPSRRRVEG